MKSNINHKPPFYIRWENRVTRRYYVVYFARDLLGWNLLTVWGGIDRRNGHHRNLPCKTTAEGIQHIQAIAKKRKQRGYQCVRGYRAELLYYRNHEN